MENNINQRFEEIVQPAYARVRERRAPAKFPELRYLWGITLLGSFVLIVIASVIDTMTR